LILVFPKGHAKEEVKTFIDILKIVIIVIVLTWC